MLVVTEVLSIDSEKVTEILSLTETELVRLSAGYQGEVEETVGPVMSTINSSTSNAVLGFPAVSVTVMEQSSYNPALKTVKLSGCVRMMVTVTLSSPELVAVVLEEMPQPPP